MDNTELEQQIKALRSAVVAIGNLVSSATVQLTGNAFLTGEPDPNFSDEENELALDRRQVMTAAKEALGRVTKE